MLRKNKTPKLLSTALQMCTWLLLSRQHVFHMFWLFFQTTLTRRLIIHHSACPDIGSSVDSIESTVKKSVRRSKGPALLLQYVNIIVAGSTTRLHCPANNVHSQAGTCLVLLHHHHHPHHHPHHHLHHHLHPIFTIFLILIIVFITNSVHCQAGTYWHKLQRQHCQQTSRGWGSVCFATTALSLCLCHPVSTLGTTRHVSVSRLSLSV